jgi:SAM-dependent methyltransferase
LWRSSNDRGAKPSVWTFRKKLNQTGMISVATNPHLAVVATPACPLCGSTRLKTKSQHDQKRLQKCRRCGVLFVMPQPSSALLASHFQTGGLVTVDDFDTHFEVNRQPVLSRVVNYIRSRKDAGTILDVGCATGFFLADLAKKSKWDARGVELSLPAAGEARRSGIQVHVGDTRSAKFKDNSFDVITVLDAFYYFPNPESELAELGRILKEDGFLALELPWANTRVWQRTAIISKLLNRSCIPLLQSSDHLFYYTPKSVSLLLEDCGFRVQTIRPLPANQQVGLLRDLLWRTYGVISQLLWRLSAGSVFLGPRFLVVAGKTRQPLAAEVQVRGSVNRQPKSQNRS